TLHAEIISQQKVFMCLLPGGYAPSQHVPGHWESGGVRLWMGRMWPAPRRRRRKNLHGPAARFTNAPRQSGGLPSLLPSAEALQPAEMAHVILAFRFHRLLGGYALHAFVAGHHFALGIALASFDGAPGRRGTEFLLHHGAPRSSDSPYTDPPRPGRFMDAAGTLP